MNRSELIVIGGGASGMMAALTAAERGVKVLLIEGEERLGRKIKQSGNGRCNFTNLSLTLERYHGAEPDFASYALNEFNNRDTIDFFRKLGVLTRTEEDRVYPLSNSSGSILDALRYALNEREVKILAPERIQAAEKSGKYFILQGASGESYMSEYLIVATGGLAGLKSGAESTYEILESFGHKRTKLYPSICKIAIDSRLPRALKGVKAEAELKLLRGEEIIAQREGELLFWESGISGPVSFDISRAVSKYGLSNLTVSIDFFVGFSHDELFKFFKKRIAYMPNLEVGELFTGSLQNRLGRMLIREKGIHGSKKLSEISDAELKEIIACAKDFRAGVLRLDSLSNAQVTAGGMETADFNSETMESKLIKNLFACGEVLDIDGDCGGYNLQWAWSSGRLAGKLGKKE